MGSEILKSLIKAGDRRRDGFGQERRFDLGIKAAELAQEQNDAHRAGRTHDGAHQDGQEIGLEDLEIFVDGYGQGSSGGR